MEDFPHTDIRVGHEGVVGPERVEIGNELVASPTEQKLLVFVLKTLRDSATLLGYKDVADAARSFGWGTRCMGLLQQTPWQALQSLRMPVTDLPSLSQFIITCKKTVDYFTIPPRLLHALSQYGALCPAINTYLTPDIVKQLSGFSGISKRLCGVSSIIEFYKNWTAPETDMAKLIQSSTLVGVTAANLFDFPNVRLTLQIASFLMGSYVLMRGDAKPKTEKTETDQTRPHELNQIENLQQLRDQSLTLLKSQFKNSLAKIEENPDEYIRFLLKGDLMEQQSSFEAYLTNAANEFQLLEALEAYRDTYLPGAIQQGLVDSRELDTLTSCFNQLLEIKTTATSEETQAKIALSEHIEKLGELRDRLSTISEPSDFRNALTGTIDDLLNQSNQLYNRLWQTQKPWEKDPIHQLSIPDRQETWTEIAKTISPASFAFLELQVSQLSQKAA